MPTVIVKICEPSSLDAQSSITVCLGAMALGVFPTALIYFFTPSNVDKLGTDIKPVKYSQNIIRNILIVYIQFPGRKILDRNLYVQVQKTTGIGLLLLKMLNIYEM